MVNVTVLFLEGRPCVLVNKSRRFENVDAFIFSAKNSCPALLDAEYVVNTILLNVGKI